jgi:hypothetical protein
VEGKKLEDFAKILPWDRALTDGDIYTIVKTKSNFKSQFRGVFLRDEFPLPVSTGATAAAAAKMEHCAIVNLDSYTGTGSHWVCYMVKNNRAEYYDSFGLPPFKELIEYLHEYDIYYNHRQDQRYNSVICGHLCLCFLYANYL